MAQRNLAGQALVTSVTRLINQGLMILSPIFLVHLLSVEEFGHYREFLLYAFMLTSFAGLGFYNSLLYFIPARPQHSRRYVVQAVAMTAVNSTIVVLAAMAIDAVFPKALIGSDVAWLAVYVLLFVNLDFWEYLWLAERRTGAVFVYTSGRLLMRMIVVVTTAALTGSVDSMIMALVGLEAVRFIGSALFTRSRLRRLQDSGGERPHTGTWREQLRYCMPVGAGMLLSGGNRSLGGLFVTTLLGPAALAHYAIGTYMQPIINVLRNSISDVLLPHMVSRQGAAAESGHPEPLAVWRRSTVVFFMMLLPTGVLLAGYAEPIVVTLFSREYLPAVIVFQIYTLVLLRECFDFSVPLRVRENTAPILRSNLLALLLHAFMLWAFVPAFGLTGAVVGFVASRFVEGVYLGRSMMVSWNISLRELGDWRDLGKVLLSLLVAVPVAFAPGWTRWFGFGGVIIGAALFTVVYAVMLYTSGIPEVRSLPARLGFAPLRKVRSAA